MDLTHIKRKPVVEEILPPVKDVQSDRLLRAAALQAIQVEPGAEAVAQVELLTYANVGSGANQQTDGSCRAAMLVSSPGAGEVEASAELIVPDAVRCDGRVLIRKV